MSCYPPGGAQNTGLESDYNRVPQYLAQASYYCKPWHSPESGYVLAPFVCIKFVGAGKQITVSNNSSPDSNPSNSACIQSFETTFEDGFSIKVTIQDQAGAEVAVFLDSLFKDWKTAKDGAINSTMEFQYGWVKSGCQVTYPNASSPVYSAVIVSMEMDISEGKVICELTGNDLCTIMIDGSSQLTVGGKGKDGVYLTDALRKLLVNNDCAPNVGGFAFVRRKGSADASTGCGISEIDQRKMSGADFVPANFWSDGTDENVKCKGPKDLYCANGRDKLTTAREWIAKIFSDRKRKFTACYDPTRKGGFMYFVEEIAPTKTESDNQLAATCVGTYLVNGSKFSPVIEFRPKIKWPFNALTSSGGGTSTTKLAPLKDKEYGSTMASPGRRDVSGLERSEQCGAGHSVMLAESDHHDSVYGPDKGQDMNQEAKDINVRPTGYGPGVIGHAAISADLVLVGDPTLGPPNTLPQRNVAVIYINPIYIRKSSRGQTDWLEKPTVNEVLSNNGWLIQNVMHRITVGNFVTTLRLWMVAPGIEIPPGSPIGGSASGAKTG